MKDFKSSLSLKRELLNGGLTRQEIMTSDVFKNISQAAVDAMTYGLGKVQNKNIYEPYSDITAYSTGGGIVVNCATPEVESEPDHKKAMLLVAGLRAHECGHELFTDFEAWVNVFETFENRIEDVIKQANALCLFKKEDLHKGIEMCKDLEKNPRKKKYVLTLLRSVMNAYEDSYVNNGIFNFFKGEPSVALRAMLKKSFDTNETLKDMFSKEMPSCVKLLNALHKEAIGYPYKNDSDNFNDEEKEIIAKMEELKEARETLPYETNVKKRIQLILKVLIRLYELIEESSKEAGEEQKDEDGSSGESSTSSSSDLTESELENLMDKLEEEAKMSAEPRGGGKPLMKLDSSKPLSKPGDKEESAENIEDALSKSLSAIAEETAEKKVEEQHVDKLKESLTEKSKKLKILERGVINFEENIYRKKKSEALIYKRLVDGIEKKVEQEKYFIVRRLKRVLQDRELEDLERRQYAGTKVFAKDAARPGMAVFAKRNEPTGKANVRICILVDMSGSMVCPFDDTTETKRFEFARNRAILFHDILKDLKVPHAIIGHTADMGCRDTLDLFSMVDYESVDDTDVYRLGGIKAISQNRDGAAICHCCEDLLNYNEGKKILIVISDGEPSHSGYLDRDPVEDAKKAVDKYRKKGIQIIGTNMNLDSERVLKYIYGDKYIDCTNEIRFKKTLVKLVSDAVLK